MPVTKKIRIIDEDGTPYIIDWDVNGPPITPYIAKGIVNAKKAEANVYKPTMYPNGPESRTATEVMQDQAANVLKGAGQAITGIPDFIRQAITAGTSGDATGITNLAKSAVQGAIQPFMPVAKTVAGNPPSPESPEWEQAAQGAGNMLVSSELPNALSGGAQIVKNLASRLPPSTTAPAVNNWMDIPANEVARGANPGRRLIEDQLIGPTKEATKANVEASLAQAGTEIEAKLKAASSKGVTIDAETPVLKALGDATKRIGTPKDVTFQGQLNGVLDDIMASHPNLDKLTPLQAHALKVELGDSIKWKGAAYDTPINQAMIQMYRDLNTAIKGKVPDIASTQARWGDLYIASKNLAESINENTVGKGSPSTPPNLYVDAAKTGLKYGVPTAIGAGVGTKVINDILNRRKP